MRNIKIVKKKSVNFFFFYQKFLKIFTKPIPLGDFLNFPINLQLPSGQEKCDSKNKKGSDDFAEKKEVLINIVGIGNKSITLNVETGPLYWSRSQSLCFYFKSEIDLSLLDYDIDIPCLARQLRLWCPMTCLKLNQKQHCLWKLLLTFLLGFEKSSQWLELLRCRKFYTLKQRRHIGLILWCPKFYDYRCGAASFINITPVVQLDGDEGGIFIPGNIIR